MEITFACAERTESGQEFLQYAPVRECLSFTSQIVPIAQVLICPHIVKSIGYIVSYV